MSRPLQTHAGVFLRGAAASFGIRVLGTGVILTAHVLVARTTSPSDYGRYSVTLTSMAVLSVVVQMGLSQSAVRFISEFVAGSNGGAVLGYARRGERLILTLGGLGIVAALIAGLFSADSKGLNLALLAGAMMLPCFASLQLLQQVMRGARRIVDAQVCEQMLVPAALGSTAVLLYRVQGQLSYVQVIWIHAGALALASGLLWVRLHKFVGGFPDSEVIDEPLRGWLEVSIPLGVVALVTIFLSQGEVLVLGAFADSASVGAYAVGLRITNVMIFGQYAANVIGGPMIGEFFARGEMEELQSNVTLGVRVASVFSVSVLLLLVLAGDWILALFGPEYVAAKTILLILAAGQTLNALSGPVGPLLSVTGEHRAYMKVMSVMAVTKLVLLVPAIIVMGVTGAAIVTATIVGIQNLWLAAVAYKRLRIVSLPVGRVRRAGRRDNVGHIQ